MPWQGVELLTFRLRATTPRAPFELRRIESRRAGRLDGASSAGGPCLVRRGGRGHARSTTARCCGPAIGSTARRSSRRRRRPSSSRPRYACRVDDVRNYVLTRDGVRASAGADAGDRSWEVPHEQAGRRRDQPPSRTSTRSRCPPCGTASSPSAARCATSSTGRRRATSSRSCTTWRPASGTSRAAPSRCPKARRRCSCRRASRCVHHGQVGSSTLQPGDVILRNDPYKGYCNHLPDWGFFRPVFYKDELLFIVLTRGHQMDTGGAFPGGYFPNGYDIHAEGIMIPPIKIVDARRRADGRAGAHLEQRPLARGRQDRQLRPDGRAQGRREPDRRAARQVRQGRASSSASRRCSIAWRPSVRSQLRPVPDGTCSGESSTDDDGTVLDEQVTVRCDATIKGDELILDFSRSDGLRKGFVNCTYSSTYSRAVAGSFLYFDSDARGVPQRGLDAAGHGHRAGGDRGQRHVPGHGRWLARERGHPGARGDRQRAVQGDARQGHRGLGSATRPLHRGCRTRAPASATSRRRPTPTAARARSTASTATRARWACPASAPSTAGRVEEIEIRFPWRTVKWHFLPDLSGAGRVARRLRHALGGREPRRRRGRGDRLVRRRPDPAARRARRRGRAAVADVHPAR